jgi:hypothetical protein
VKNIVSFVVKKSNVNRKVHKDDKRTQGITQKATLAHIVMIKNR